MSGPSPYDYPGPDGRTIPGASYAPTEQAPAQSPSPAPAPAPAPPYPASPYPTPQPAYPQSPYPQAAYPQPVFAQAPYPQPMPGYALPPQQVAPEVKQPNVAGGFSAAGLWLALLACFFGAVGSTGTQVFYSVWYGAFPLSLVALVLSVVGLTLKARRVAAWFGLVLSILCLLGMLGFMAGQYNQAHSSSAGSYAVPAAGFSASTR